MATVHHRRVRSFVRRPGRTTKSQQRALETLWPRWGIPFAPAKIDWPRVFGRETERVLDIGFGDGEALLTCAVNNPDVDFVGVEIHEPGIGHLLVLLEQAGIDNVRIVDRDVVDVIEQMIPPNSFDVVNIFFPDPWPKKRHHKRRLIKPAFLRQLGVVMRRGSLLHIATDWANYAEHAVAVCNGQPNLREIRPAVDDRLALRPPTKFERRGRRLGHDIVDLYYAFEE